MGGWSHPERARKSHHDHIRGLYARKKVRLRLKISLALVTLGTDNAHLRLHDKEISVWKSERGRENAPWHRYECPHEFHHNRWLSPWTYWGCVDPMENSTEATSETDGATKNEQREWWAVGRDGPQMSNGQRHGRLGGQTGLIRIKRPVCI